MCTYSADIVLPYQPIKNKCARRRYNTIQIHKNKLTCSVIAECVFACVRVRACMRSCVSHAHARARMCVLINYFMAVS